MRFTLVSLLPCLTLAQVLPPYYSHGCYTEGYNARALDHKIPDNADNTVEACATACLTSIDPVTEPPYTLFGLEYGTECYCASSLAVGSFPAFSLADWYHSSSLPFPPTHPATDLSAAPWTAPARPSSPPPQSAADPPASPSTPPPP